MSIKSIIERLVSDLNAYEESGGVEFWEDVIPVFYDLVDTDESVEAEKREFGGETCVIILVDGSRIVRDCNRRWRHGAN